MSSEKVYIKAWTYIAIIEHTAAELALLSNNFKMSQTTVSMRPLSAALCAMLLHNYRSFRGFWPSNLQPKHDNLPIFTDFTLFALKRDTTVAYSPWILHLITIFSTAM